MHKLLSILGASLAVVLLSAGMPTTYAASAKLLLSSSKDIQVGDQIRVTIRVTADEDLNALQGTLRFDPAYLTLETPSTGDSIIPLWVDLPANAGLGDVNRAGIFTFSGVIPGGISGLQNDEALSVVFRAHRAGTTRVTLDGASLLLNDGHGTPESIPSVAQTVTIATSSRAADTVQEGDTMPPAPFTAERSRTSALFGGQWFLVFSTRDAGSGVDHYEVAECRGCSLEAASKKMWRTASSPYLLRDQSLRSTVYVRAVDRLGNIRVATIPPNPQGTGTARIVLLVLVLIACIVLIGRHLHGKRS